MVFLLYIFYFVFLALIFVFSRGGVCYFVFSHGVISSFHAVVFYVVFFFRMALFRLFAITP